MSKHMSRRVPASTSSASPAPVEIDEPRRPLLAREIVVIAVVLSVVLSGIGAYLLSGASTPGATAVAWLLVSAGPALLNGCVLWIFARGVDAVEEIRDRVSDE